MIDAQQATPGKVFTDLTCWKCGEESLKESVGATESFSSTGEKMASAGSKHSDCQKCGAYSVSPAQARHNKIVGRHNRKAGIKEANRKSG
jgi:hypothetical protein